jgi:hypothetical protein
MKVRTIAILAAAVCCASEIQARRWVLPGDPWDKAHDEQMARWRAEQMFSPSRAELRKVANKVARQRAQQEKERAAYERLQANQRRADPTAASGSTTIDGEVPGADKITSIIPENSGQHPQEYGR